VRLPSRARSRIFRETSRQAESDRILTISEKSDIEGATSSGAGVADGPHGCSYSASKSVRKNRCPTSFAPLLVAHVALLNQLHADGGLDLDAIEGFWIARVLGFFAAKPFRIRPDALRSFRTVVRDVLNQAEERQKTTSYFFVAIGSMLRPRWLPQKSFPPYAYLPGKQPHPVRDPGGHSYHVEPSPVAAESSLGSDVFLWDLDLFNHGYYWEAHEAWEGLWQVADRDGPPRMLFKGLILLSAAGIKIRERKHAAAARHTKRAAALLRS
jgi:Domain of unknown function (DUF309)